MTRLITAPLDVGGRRLGRTQAELAVVSGLYRGAAGWPELMNALARGCRRRRAAERSLADRYTGRRADRLVQQRDGSPLRASTAWTSAAGSRRRRLRRSARDRGRSEASRSSRRAAGAAVRSGPPRSRPAGRRARREGAPPILVIGGEADPATPIEGAVALAKTLDSGTLLRWAGTGHTALGGAPRALDDARSSRTS